MSRYIKETERYKIETMLEDGKTPKQIATRLGKHYTTIYREIKRGTVYLRDGRTWKDIPTYCADASQRIMEEKGHNKGRELKIGNDHSTVKKIEYLIKEKKYSPYAVSMYLKYSKESLTYLCTSTLYQYVDKGIFLNVTNEDLTYKKQSDKCSNLPRRPSFNMLGARTIEERPNAVYERDNYGDWEMDTVVGGRGKSRECLLVLTERQTREEIIKRLVSKTADAVLNQINELENCYGVHKFKNIFHTITCDNGVEFSKYKEIEQSCINVGFRTMLYFCHPYCSSERGSNENANRLIRKFIPKGSDISQYDDEYIKNIQEWMNNYPRRIFGGLSVNQYKRSLGIP